MTDGWTDGRTNGQTSRWTDEADDGQQINQGASVKDANSKFEAIKKLAHYGWILRSRGWTEDI